jgi:hypothetical protein
VLLRAGRSLLFIRGGKTSLLFPSQSAAISSAWSSSSVASDSLTLLAICDIFSQAIKDHNFKLVRRVVALPVMIGAGQREMAPAKNQNIHSSCK